MLAKSTLPPNPRGPRLQTSDEHPKFPPNNSQGCGKKKTLTKLQGWELLTSRYSVHYGILALGFSSQKISNMPGVSPLHFCNSWPFQKPKAGLFSQKNDVIASWSSNLNAWTSATSETCVALLHPCKKNLLYIPVARCRSNASLGPEEHGVFCYRKNTLRLGGLDVSLVLFVFAWFVNSHE